MQIKRCCHQEQRENDINIAAIIREFESQQPELSAHELDMGRRALEKALSGMHQFEKAHPKIESAERRQQFERIVDSAAEMAEIFGLDVCAKVDRQLNGHLSISTDSLLLRREYSPNFLPLMKKLMDMCDEFYAAPIEKDGETLTCLSFVVPLYVRKV